ncbi:MAG: MTH1187 family thiamine-binding protein [bacterium]|nr:MTH1187 family thiamine-binding protein [bacterium]
MPIMEISVVPIGTATASVGDYVARAVAALEGRDDLRWELTAMGTIVEAGSVERLLEAALDLHRAVVAAGAPRVVTSIRIDDRRDAPLTAAGKVESVRARLRGGRAPR